MTDVLARSAELFRMPLKAGAVDKCGLTCLDDLTAIDEDVLDVASAAIVDECSQLIEQWREMGLLRASNTTRSPTRPL